MDSSRSSGLAIVLGRPNERGYLSRTVDSYSNSYSPISHSKNAISRALTSTYFANLISS
jgi:hypothetical protein